MRVHVAALVWLLATIGVGHASQTIDRVRADGMLHCGAVPRPGIAAAPPEGGVAVELCRAIAIAILGPAARVSFRLYEAPDDYDGVRRGSDEVAFVTGGEIADQDLAGSIVPGQTVLITMVGIMVPETSSLGGLSDLAGQTVCLMIGSRAQRALESFVQRRQLAISRLTFEEDVEMLDAYNAGSCGAAVGETTYLADMRRDPGIRGLASRLLAEPLDADPVIAVTPRDDGPWAATVAWVIDALVLADAPADAWQTNALPTKRIAELRPNWRSEVIAAVGSYGAIIRRNLTDRLGLPPGPNALWPAGMLLPPAVR